MTEFSSARDCYGVHGFEASIALAKGGGPAFRLESKRSDMMRKLPLLMIPVLLAGCQTWGPTWSEVTGQKYNVTISNRRPAIIDRVDDQGAFPDPRLIRITPGEHRLVVQGPAPGWPGGPPLHVMMLNAAPCKRYYINAQFENPVAPNWTPVIDYAEDIPGCQVPGKS
jgi:hypothetical protein